MKFELSINDTILDRVDHTKFLGVYIDEKLKWYKHIMHIKGKIARGVGLMLRMRNVLSQKTLLLLYHALIFPYLTYGNIGWGCASKIYLDPLLLLQKKAVRICAGASYLAHSGHLFKSLNILKIADINRVQILLFMFKYKYNMLPKCCNHYVVVNNNNTRVHQTRCCHYFKEVGCRTNIRSYCISVQGPKFFNSLPINLQTLTSIAIFKRSIIKDIMTSYS